jgi:hypothetical protein
MRTYRKRPAELRYCVHCHTPFESNHKRRIYCGNSCSTLAYYARKAHARVPSATSASPLGASLLVAPIEAPTPPAVTLALNAQNLALFTAGPLLADGLKQAFRFVGNLFTPTPQAGPSTWLPLLFRLVKQPLVPFEHVDWDEPRFFVPLEWRNTLFYYRAAQDLLFWQDPEGHYQQLTNKAEFEQVLNRPRSQPLLLQQGLAETSTALTSGLTLPPLQLKDFG